MADENRVEVKKSDDRVRRLRASVSELLKHRDLIFATSAVLQGVSPARDREFIEMQITEMLSPLLTHLTRVVEADESALRAASESLSEEERAVILEMYRTLHPFKMAIQSANLFEQGYLNRITLVRYRPYVFLLSNVPAVDITLRSFDRNVLRFADSIDNAMRVGVGILRGVSESYQRAKALGVPMPEEIARRCAAFADEVGVLMQAMSDRPLDSKRESPKKRARKLDVGKH